MFRMKFDEVNKVWSSSDNIPSVFNPNISVGNILLKSMEIHGPKIAQISDDTGERFTFEEIRLRTIRASQNLQKRGFNSKQMVGIIAGNVANLSPIVFASVCLGGPISVLHISMDKLKLLSMFQLTEPSLIFCETKVYDLVAECLSELGNKATVFILNGVKGDSEAAEHLFEETGCEEDFIPVEVDGINETAFVMSTSGSTGPSKGVCISHATLISELETNVKMLAHGIVFNSSSIYWISGLHSILQSIVGGSTRVMTSEPFSVELQLRLIKDEKLTEGALDIDGFFSTGDIGHIDKDFHLFLAGRKKNVIAQQDEWVFPSEIEAILLQSSEISSVCVVGVPFDEVIELPAAVVVRTVDSNITEDEICKMVEDNLPACCKLEGGVYFLDSIGITVSGKLIHREAKEIAKKLYTAKRKRINVKRP